MSDAVTGTTPRPEFDVVLWGATGFTGRLVAEHLLRRSRDEPFRLALGGRNEHKLASVRDALSRETGIDAGSLPLVLGDAGDPVSMAALASRTRVVCSTVGPYARYGSELVEACVRAGVHYCDLTGEVQWMRRMIDRHHDAAVSSGARIVFTCGFDCIPSDLGTWFLQREAIARFGAPCSRVSVRVGRFRGGASGGTIASMLHILDEAERDPEVRRIMAEPYSLNPKDQRSGPDTRERLGPFHDPDFGEWVAPFVMAGVDTKVARRSNALLRAREAGYGPDFRYDEGMLAGAGPLGFAKACSIGATTLLGMGAMAIGPVRRTVARRLPQPGEGPDRETREAGHYEIHFLGREAGDSHGELRTRVRGDLDPGYGSTSKMLGESALCLALDPLDTPGGCSTPAAAMGNALIVRLEGHAGVRFELV